MCLLPSLTSQFNPWEPQVKEVRAPTGCPLTSITKTCHTCTVPTTLPILRGKKAIVKVNMPYCHSTLGRDRAEDKANLFLASKPRDTAGMVRCCPGLFKGCKASFPETAHRMGSVLWACASLSAQLDSLFSSQPPHLCHQPQLLWLPFSHQSFLFSHHCKPVENG